MRYFLMINALSAIFALLPFIMSEMLVNVYRINRITGVEIAVIDRVNAVIGLLCFSFSIITFVFMIKKRFLPSKKTNLFSSIIWVPYYWLYISIFASQFPITNPADKANPASGFIIIAGLLLYPIILAGMNAIALLLKSHNSLS
ncbi:hypothetical protein FHS19_003179 [Paenibacillus rhizosphaerae]|uniref:Uncharacterized protein n=1 Tax=Paenibacillus rhizosphaerae TaxID=297318 RepID=A0A839TP32_9BACL|nr:hypothetical protein [Paenibacillus rhizosphaerae]MBB3128525.1 hypothetical protein [Paenibacillus rhizosphaerae]